MSPEPSSRACSASSSSTLVRTLVLIVLLGLLLAGLWYDRKVARPAVENAFATVAGLADKMNLSGSLQTVTDRDVQAALQRAPTETLQDGPYHIEVYRFRSGLPFRSYRYYAVYGVGEGSGKPHTFLTHSAWELPRAELFPQPVASAAPEATGKAVPKWSDPPGEKSTGDEKAEVKAESGEGAGAQKD